MREIRARVRLSQALKRLQGRSDRLFHRHASHPDHMGGATAVIKAVKVLNVMTMSGASLPADCREAKIAGPSR